MDERDNLTSREREIRNRIAHLDAIDDADEQEFLRKISNDSAHARHDELLDKPAFGRYVEERRILTMWSSGPKGRVGLGKRSPIRPPSNFRVVSFKEPNPPGTTISRFARILLTKRAFDLYVAPAIADLQYEYAEAAQRGDIRLARWIVVRGFFALVWPWVWALMKSVAGKLLSLLIRSL